MFKKINFSYNADYSANSFFPFYDAKKIYNAILIPEDLIDNFDYFDIGNHITIEYDNKKSNYPIAYRYETITLKKKKYLLFYIGIGIPIEDGLLHQTEYKIIIKQKEILLDTSLNLRKNSAKLFMGILVLSDFYDFAFNNGDNIILKINNEEFITIKTDQKDISYNVYAPHKHNTMLFLDLNSSTNEITQLHKIPILNSISVRSLTTKRNKQKGSFSLNCSGTYNLVLTSDNSYNQTHKFSNYINIQNLDYGQYTFQILDSNNNSIELLYQDLLYKKISFNIVGSSEEENIILMNTMKLNGINQGLSQILPRI